jgi:nucleoside-diphosphate-sugar epimerase
MKALVTGAAGFIGRHLCTALVEGGHEVTALDRKIDRRYFLDSVRIHKADCTKASDLEKALEGIDTVFHLAGVKRAKKASLYHEINAGGMATLLTACQRKGAIRRLLFISSLAASGPSGPDRQLREVDEPKPTNEYGRSKLRAEKILAAGSVPWTVIRAPVVYGPGIKDTIFLLVGLAARHLQPVIGSGEANFIYVGDLVSGLIAAAEYQRSENRLYYLAHPRVHKWSEIYDTVREVVGTWTLRIRLPFIALKTAARIADAVTTLSPVRLAFSRRNLEDIRHSYWTVDVGRATRELGFQAQVGLKEGIKKLFEWQKRVV